MKTETWNKLQNEGGEGYVPNQPMEFGKSDKYERRARLLRIMEGTSTDAPEYAVYSAEVASLTAEIDNEWLVEGGWTVESTQARRSDLNAWLRTQGKIVSRGGLNAWERKHGYTRDDVKRAMSLLKIS